MFELHLSACCEAREEDPAAPQLLTPDRVYGELKELGNLRQEMFVVLLLDIRNRLTARQMVSLGSLNTTTVHPREVFRAAVEFSAAAVILVHNHPSGDPAPSSTDLTLTRRLVQAGDLMGISVLDHVIIGRPRDGSEGWLSLRESGLVNFNVSSSWKQTAAA